jgi:hypothetical protein
MVSIAGSYRRDVAEAKTRQQEIGADTNLLELGEE